MVFVLAGLPLLHCNQARPHTTGKAEPCNTIQPEYKATVLEPEGGGTKEHQEDSAGRCSNELCQFLAEVTSDFQLAPEGGALANFPGHVDERPA